MARSFPGGVATDSVIVTQASVINNVAPLMVFCWFKMAANPVGNTQIVVKGQPVAGSGLFLLRTNGTSNLQFVAPLWGTTVGIFTIPFPTINVWHSIVIWYQYALTTDVPLISLDNNPQGVTVVTAPVGTLGTETKNLAIGNNTAGTLCFNGSICEVTMSNTPSVSAAQITQLNNGASTENVFTPNLLGYWPLFGDQSPEPDYSPNGNNGVVTGTTSIPGPTVLGLEVAPRQMGQIQQIVERVQIVDY